MNLKNGKRWLLTGSALLTLGLCFITNQPMRQATIVFANTTSQTTIEGSYQNALSLYQVANDKIKTANDAIATAISAYNQTNDTLKWDSAKDDATNEAAQADWQNALFGSSGKFTVALQAIDDANSAIGAYQTALTAYHNVNENSPANVFASETTSFGLTAEQVNQYKQTLIDAISANQLTNKATMANFAPVKSAVGTLESDITTWINGLNSVYTPMESAYNTLMKLKLAASDVADATTPTDPNNLALIQSFNPEDMKTLDSQLTEALTQLSTTIPTDFTKTFPTEQESVSNAINTFNQHTGVEKLTDNSKTIVDDVTIKIEKQLGAFEGIEKTIDMYLTPDYIKDDLLSDKTKLAQTLCLILGPGSILDSTGAPSQISPISLGITAPVVNLNITPISTLIVTPTLNQPVQGEQLNLSDLISVIAKAQDLVDHTTKPDKDTQVLRDIISEATAFLQNAQAQNQTNGYNIRARRATRSVSLTAKDVKDQVDRVNRGIEAFIASADIPTNNDSTGGSTSGGNDNTSGTDTGNQSNNSNSGSNVNTPSDNNQNTQNSSNNSADTNNQNSSSDHKSNTDTSTSNKENANGTTNVTGLNTTDKAKGNGNVHTQSTTTKTNRGISLTKSVAPTNSTKLPKTGDNDSYGIIGVIMIVISLFGLSKNVKNDCGLHQYSELLLNHIKQR